MEYRTLEIIVISAKDLKKVNLICATSAYAVISIVGDPRSSQQQRTAVDWTGKGSPTWNFPVRFAVNESAARSNRLAVTFRICCKRPSLGDKDIGVVHVPLSELVGSIGDGISQFVTYQVRKRSRKPKGELNFSYKWGDKIVGPPAMEVNRSHSPVTATATTVDATTTADATVAATTTAASLAQVGGDNGGGSGCCCSGGGCGGSGCGGGCGGGGCGGGCG